MMFRIMLFLFTMIFIVSIASAQPGVHTVKSGGEVLQLISVYPPVETVRGITTEKESRPATPPCNEICLDCGRTKQKRPDRKRVFLRLRRE